jgi:eukaryotic-like serine/threonine-protein kinase
MASRLLTPGDVVAGKYRIESLLGEGGMGFVLGARNIALDEPVAIKVLRPEALSDGQSVARFMREARASVRMKGVHVAKVLDVGSLDDGTPYMLMELLVGADLSTLLERYGCLSVPVAVDYVLQACEALAEAHALGIIHRDIKPSNLFLTTGVDGTPCLKVLDFGISKATSAIDAMRPDFGLTQTQTVMGSPQYMAPEQMRSSRRVDGRTDIWGLGTIMHELLVGDAPFVAATMPELFAMILQDPAPSLRARRPDVPAGLDAVVLRCLEKSPDARPSDVAELARLLVPFASPLSAGAAERVARVGRTVATASANLHAQRESAPSLPGSLGSGSDATVMAPHALGSGPSSPELAHSNTTQLRGPRPPGTSARVLLVAAAVLSLVVALGAAAALRARRAPDPGQVAAGGAVPSATAPTLDTPPPVTEAPPPVVEALSAVEPPVSAAASQALPAASSAPASVLKRPGKAGVTGARPAPSAAPSPAPSPSAVRAADPPKPAATASSRYD